MAELKSLLRHARDFIYGKLPARTRSVLALPAAERKKLVAARKKLLARK